MVKINNFRIKLDKTLDYIPLVSILNNAIDMIQKRVFTNKKSPSPYQDHIVKKTYKKCSLFMVPFAKPIYEIVQRVLKKPETEKTEEPSSSPLALPEFALDDNQTIKGPLTEEQFFPKLFDLHEGIFINDNHNDIVCIDYMIELIPILAKMNVKHLYIETPRSQLDSYEQFNQCEEDSEEYKRFIESLRNNTKGDTQFFPGFSPMTAALHIQARRYGIQLIPIDAEANKDAVFDMEGDIINRPERLRTSNSIWVDSIRESNNTLHEGEKYVIFGGGAHAKTNLGVKGVAEELKIPVIGLRDQYDFKELREAQRFNTHQFIYKGVVPEEEFTMVVRPANCKVETVPQGGFVLPVKEVRFEKLVKEFSCKIELPVSYSVGKRIGTALFKNEEARTYIDKEPGHTLEIQCNNEGECETLANRWGDKASIDKESHKIVLRFLSNQAFEEFLSN